MTNVLVFAGFFVFVGVFIAIAISAEKKRVAKLLEAMKSANVQVLYSLDQRDPGVAESVFGRVGMMRGLPTGGRGVRYAGATTVNGREAVILEHSYTSGSGKNESTVRHSMIAVDCPFTWPELTLTPEGPLRKLAEMVGHKDIQLEDSAFNDRWRLKGSDEEFALVLLSRPMQERLAGWPKDYWISIGLGAIVITARGLLKAERVHEMIRLLTDFTQMIPAEMEMWSAGTRPSAAR